MLDAYVLCRSPERALRLKRYQDFPGIRFSYFEGYDSYYRFIHDALEEADSDQVLVLHDDVWLGRQFEASVRDLIVELDRDYPNWGVAGNAGVRVDDGRVYRFVKDPHGGSQGAYSPKPVLAVDGNLLLINRKNFRASQVDYPDLGGFHGYDLVLGLECLAAGLTVLADPRLMVFHESGGSQQPFDDFVSGEVFRDYLTRRFINHSVFSLNGLVDVSGEADFGYLDINRPDDRKDILACYDQALKQSRKDRKPSLTIGVRSQLERPELLERALASMAVLASDNQGLVELQVAIVSDAPEAELLGSVARLSGRFPSLPLTGWHVADHGPRFSRANLLIEAFGRCESDYLWFVDDDDFVLPDSIRAVWRRMSPRTNNLIIASSDRYFETWSRLSDHTLFLEHFRYQERIPASNVLDNFTGDNFLPICSAFFPVRLMRERLREVRGLGDYYEDYFLLMLCMTAPGVELETLDAPVAGISIREAGNTVTEGDRSHWNFSYASFMGELIGGSLLPSPLLWNAIVDLHSESRLGEYTRLKHQYEDIRRGFERLQKWNEVQDEQLLERNWVIDVLKRHNEALEKRIEKLDKWYLPGWVNRLRQAVRRYFDRYV